MMEHHPIFSRTVVVAAIPSSGLHQTLTATDAERQAIAAEYGLVEVGALSAELTLARIDDDSVAVDGQVRADIVQSCVVSLEPVPQKIDEPVHLRLVNAASAKAPPPPRPGAEILVGAEPVEPPDTYSGPEIDLGAIVLEHFALGIDPYPRAPGAALEAPAEDVEVAETSPFAALAGLVNRKN